MLLFAKRAAAGLVKRVGGGILRETVSGIPAAKGRAKWRHKYGAQGKSFWGFQRS
jgi:hypothetical protein